MNFYSNRSNKKRRIFLILLVLFLSVLPLEAEEPSVLILNPIERLESYPLALPHLSYSPAMIYPEGSTVLSLPIAWGSIETVRPGYYLDAEVRIFKPSIQHALTPEWHIRAALPLIWKGGGSMDGIIEDFHDVFGFPQGGRDRRPDNQYRVDGRSHDESFAFTEEGFGFGSFESSVIYDPFSKQRHRLILSGTLSMPTITSEYGHRGIDSAVELQYRMTFQQFLFYLGLQQAFVSDTHIEGLSYRNTYTSFIGGASYRMDDLGLMVSLQAYSRSAYTEGVPDHPDSELLIDVMLHKSLGEQLLLSIGLQENPGPGEGSTDVAGLLGLQFFWY